ncbi:MAG: hypothetical protein QM760_23030 [Nibricoccus sp.]
MERRLAALERACSFIDWPRIKEFESIWPALASITMIGLVLGSARD